MSNKNAEAVERGEADLNVTSGRDSAATSLLLHRWGQLFRSALLLAHILWIQAFLVLGRFYVSFVGGHINSFTRKIVVVGDDTALGLGDWVTVLSYPGIHRRLNDRINHDVMKRLVGRGVFWNAFDGGKSGSTTADWIPDRDMTTTHPNSQQAKLRRKWKLIGTRNIFDSLFDPNVGQHRNADIVVVCLGKYDTVKKIDVVETQKNLRIIVSQLVKRNKYVIVCTVPPFPVLFQSTSRESQQADCPTARSQWRARNQAIMDLVPSIRQELPRECQDMVHAADVCKGLPPDVYRFDGAFLAGKGYDHVANSILEVLTPVMRLVDGDKGVLKASANYSHFR